MNNDIIKPSRTFIFLFMVPLVILMITLIAYFKVNQGKAFIGTIMLGILVACIRAKWMLRKHVEFWVAIAMILLVESLMVVYIPWTSKWVPAIVLLPFGILNGFLIFWVIQLAEKMVHGKSATIDES